MCCWGEPPSSTAPGRRRRPWSPGRRRWNPRPVESLAAVRSALRPGGVVVVMEERAEEEFAPDGSEVERLLAVSSVLHCLPVGRSQPGSEATGALFRPSTMRSYADRAGFGQVEVAPVDHDFFRFFVLRP